MDKERIFTSKRHMIDPVINAYRAFFVPKRGKVILVTLVVVLLVYGAYQAWLAHTEPSYATQVVTVGSLEKSITALGNLHPKEYADIALQVAGRLKKVYVKVGDTVEKGQRLAEIDPTVYATKVDAGQASLKVLQVQLAAQQAMLAQRSQEYHQLQAAQHAGTVNRQRLDDVFTAYTHAQSAVEFTRSQITSTTANLRKDLSDLSATKMDTPIRGTVVMQALHEGQTLSPNPATPTVLRIANLDVMTLNVQVAATEGAELMVGTPLSLTVPTHPTRRWESKIRQIIPHAGVDGRASSYTVVADIANPDRALTTQMTAQVFFLLRRVKDLPIVPLAALQKTTDGQGYQVSILTDHGLKIRHVRIALANHAHAAIASGLKAGEQVVVSKSDTPQKNTHQQS